MIVVLPSTVAEAFVPPKVTVAPVAKPEPEIVTAVPPATGPDEGVTVLIFGAVFCVAAKNSDMFGAVAAAPGKLVRPRASAINRNVLWCWKRVFDSKFCGVLLLMTTVAI